MKTSREIALERRKAMSDSGKKAVANSSTTKDRVRTSNDVQISGIKPSIDTNTTNTAKKHIPTAKMTKKSFSKNLIFWRKSFLKSFTIEGYVNEN